MDNIVVPLGLLGLGLYIIMNINNDDNQKYVKNSGSLNTKNNLDINNNKNNLDINNGLSNNYTNQFNDMNDNFLNVDNTKLIDE
jgi:hypothetical protein